jgi:hypothetical protein
LTPSDLPTDEAELIYSTLHPILLKNGFQRGVFHIEGRVRDFTMHYTTTEDGVLDLLPTRTVKSPNKPSCFLIEINMRRDE